MKELINNRQGKIILFGQPYLNKKTELSVTPKLVLVPGLNIIKEDDMPEKALVSCLNSKMGRAFAKRGDIVSPKEQQEKKESAESNEAIAIKKQADKVPGLESQLSELTKVNKGLEADILESNKTIAELSTDLKKARSEAKKPEPAKKDTAKTK